MTEIEEIEVVSSNGYKCVGKFEPTERNMEMLINKINELTERVNKLSAS